MMIRRKKTERQIADLMVKSMHRLEVKAIKAARQASINLRKASRQAITQKKPKIVTDRLVQDLQPILRDTMLVQHLQGHRRSQLFRTDRSLQLAFFDDVLKQLGSLTGVDIKRLNRQYNTRAFQVLRDVSISTNKRLRERINELVREGVPVKTGVAELEKEFETLGLSPKKSYQLETIFRTQSQLAFGAGRYLADQDDATQEILWGYKYVTVGDSRVRPSHAVLDGVTLPKNHPFWNIWWPPNGWNCRCQVIPIFDERKVVRPPRSFQGVKLKPDEGFEFNPGIALTT